jgi:hypothetical protein
MKRKALNFVLFQAGWFSCVVGAAKGLPWLGLLAVGLVVTTHLTISEKPHREGRLVIFAITIGLLFDSALVTSGWLAYPNGMPIAGLAPYWIVAMWALFATTLNVSMEWIKSNLWLASVMGAVFGPLSYMAGQRLGALTFINFNAAIIGLAIIWAIAMPLLVIVARRLSRARENKAGFLVQRLPGTGTG